MIGQLYLVKIRGRLRDSKAIEYLTLIVSAGASDEVAMKIPYFLDKTLYNEFQVQGIERVKPNFHLVERRIVSAEEYRANKEIAALMQQDDATSKETSPTLQPRNRNVYAFGLIGYLTGRNEKQALLKASDFLVQKSMGSNTELPFIAHGHFILESLGEDDNTKRANLNRDDPMVFRSGRLTVSGGGCSPR